MKKYLICDTETTGLPISYSAPYTNTDNYPRVIELSWELCWENGETIEKACDLIAPDGWRFPTGDFWNEHGFNEADSLMYGVPAKEAFAKLAVAMCLADVFICHNLAYDKPVIECEMFRYKIAPRSIYKELQASSTKEFIDTMRPENIPLKRECTKLLSTPILKLPGFKGQYSWPRLEVAYEFAFGKKMSRAHHASADVEATKQLYLWIKSLEEIL